MTTDLAERRRGRVFTLFLIAGALAAVAAVTVAIDIRSSRPDLASGPVVANLSQTIGAAQRIIITSADASYRIEKTQRGWAMRDRGDYPVLSSRLAQLTEGLQNLRYVRRMTSDASKHERLGVGDPRHDGNGVLVQIEDSRGALLVSLILGVQPNGLYVRRPDDPQTWAARGQLPPLRNVAAWLDLSPLDLSAERIARVEITPAEGRAYSLGRDGAEAGWRIVSPAIATLAQSSVAAVAEHVTQLAPVDVQPAPAIQGAPKGHVSITTFDGVQVEAELVESEGHTWVKLVAHAVDPAQENAALAINSRAAAWAYALSDLEVEEFAPPLSRLAPGN